MDSEATGNTASKQNQQWTNKNRQDRRFIFNLCNLAGKQRIAMQEEGFRIL